MKTLWDFAWKPKKKNSVWKYPEEVKEKARQLVLSGQSKSSVSRELGVSYVTIHRWTEDIKRKKGDCRIEGRTLEFMREIMRKGYVIADHRMDKVTKNNAYRTAKKYFPVKKVNVRKRYMIFFLEGKEEKAFQAYLRRFGGKLISYRVLRMAAGAFGIRDNRKAEGIVRNVKSGDKKLDEFFYANIK